MHSLVAHQLVNNGGKDDHVFLFTQATENPARTVRGQATTPGYPTPPRYMHFLFAFIYPRKLSTITAFPHSSHQHIIKWLPIPLGTYLPRYLPYAVGYLGRCTWLPREVRICGVGRGCGSCAVRGGVLTGPTYLLNLLVKLTGPSYSNVCQGSSRHDFHSVCSALPLPKRRRVQAPACPSTSSACGTVVFGTTGFYGSRFGREVTT